MRIFARDAIPGAVRHISVEPVILVVPASAGKSMVNGFQLLIEEAAAAPSGGGGASRCVSFGHPLELWYNTSGAGGGSYNFEFTDAEISALVDSGRGVDESYASEGSNRSP